MRVKGIHYGLTLLYSYLLPLLDVEEVSSGFKFVFKFGIATGTECVFNESTLETQCILSSPINSTTLENVLGVSKKHLFNELCMYVSSDNCIAKIVSLIYDRSYKKPILYAIYLSRNTSYFNNAIRWTREILFSGDIRSNSVIPREFREVKHRLDAILERNDPPHEEAVNLLGVRGVGVKSVKAFLLHAYGLTQEAPLDRHYINYLGLKSPLNIKKERCISSMLKCYECTYKCPYTYTVRRFGKFNGLIQSIVYIFRRLQYGGSGIEEILVRDPSKYIDGLEQLLERMKGLFVLAI